MQTKLRPLHFNTLMCLPVDLHVVGVGGEDRTKGLFTPSGSEGGKNNPLNACVVVNINFNIVL